MKKLLSLTLLLLLNLSVAMAQWNFSMVYDISLPEKITVQVGRTIDLKQYVTFQPAGASATLTWNVGNNGYYMKVENDQLTGLSLGTNLELRVTCPGTQTTIGTSTLVDVVEVEAESVNILYNDDIYLEVGQDVSSLLEFLNNACEVSPADATCRDIDWSVGDETILDPEDFTPLAVGTTTLTAYVNFCSGTGYVKSPTSITVHVVKKVTDVTIEPDLNQHECNVGDDLTDYLNGLVKVWPEDATDRRVKWSVRMNDFTDPNNIPVRIGTDGKITAVSEGSVLLEVESVSNPRQYAVVTVNVHNQKTDLAIVNNTLNYVFDGTSIDVGNDLSSNITALPADAPESNGFTITSSNPAVVTITDAFMESYPIIQASVVGVGDATLTATLTYIDYLASNNKAGTRVKKTVSKTFNVHVESAVTPVSDVAINSQLAQHDCTVGDDLTDYLNGLVVVSPQDATDPRVEWTVRPDNTNADNQPVQISADGKITAVKAGTAVLEVASVSNPRKYDVVTVVVHNPARDIRMVKQTISADYKGEPVRITNDVIQNIMLLPEGYDEIESFTVTSSDESIVRIWDVGGAESINLLAEALAEGQSTITVTVNYTDWLGQLTNPKGSNKKSVTETFTVNVVTTYIPVKNITIAEHPSPVNCTIGTDLTNYLNKLVKIEPTNAYEQAVTWSVTEGDAVTIDDKGTISAAKFGLATLTVTSVSNPAVKATVLVSVHNPAREVKTLQSQLTVDWKGAAVDVSQQIIDNIKFLPEDYDEIESLTMMTDDDEILSLSDLVINGKTISLKATALAEGEAYITVRLQYSKHVPGVANPAKGTSTKVFFVTIAPAPIPVESVTINSQLAQHDCNVGDDLTAYLNNLVVVLPENAADKRVEWTVRPDDTNANNQPVQISANGKITAVKSGTAVLEVASVSNPRKYDVVTVVVHNPARDIRIAKQTINVTFKGEPVRISNDIIKNITLLPEGYDEIESFSVTSSNESIVRIWDVGGAENINLMAEALAEGRATITVSLNYTSYLAKQTKTVTKTFVVNVVPAEIPVESVAINSQLAQHDCNVGDNLTTYLNNLVVVQPENATDKTVTWSVTKGDAVSVSAGKISAVKAGTATLTVTSVSNSAAKATIQVVVHNPARDIQLASNKLTFEYEDAPFDISNELTANVTLLPAGYAETSRYTVTSDNSAVVSINDALPNIINGQVTGAGTANITVSLSYTTYLLDSSRPGASTTETVTKQFAVEVTQKEKPKVAFAIPDDVTLSTLVAKDYELALNMTNEQYFVPEKMQIVITDTYNGENPFSVSVTNGRHAEMQGIHIGNYRFEVSYDGETIKTVSGKTYCTAHVEAEIALPTAGWDWISIPYLPANSNSIGLTQDFMGSGSAPRLLEIRSQEGLLYNDPSAGLYGDIAELNATSGMYKVLAGSAAGSSNVINLGSDARVLARGDVASIAIPEGYTWVNNPNEYDLTLADLKQLQLNGVDGDVIIGQNGSAAFDILSKRWIGNSSFRLQAGKGYIFYTSISKHQPINLLFRGRPTTVTPAPSRVAAQRSNPWELRNRGFADNMPVLARIVGLDRPDDYAIGDFVGDECRGEGAVVVRDIMMVDVAGERGEKVTFRLYDRTTGEEYSLDGKVRLTAILGSLSAPLRLQAPAVTGISQQPSADERPSAVYSVSGQKLVRPRKGVNIVDGKKIVY